MSLTDEQEEHLEFIIDEFEDNYDIKYRAGQKEHKGNLFDVPALELAKFNLEEAMDGVGYGVTTITQLENVIAILKDDTIAPKKRIEKALKLLE